MSPTGRVPEAVSGRRTKRGQGERGSPNGSGIQLPGSSRQADSSESVQDEQSGPGEAERKGAVREGFLEEGCT